MILRSGGLPGDSLLGEFAASDLFGRRKENQQLICFSSVSPQTSRIGDAVEKKTEKKEKSV